MSHNILLKYGWTVVFESKRLTVYEFDCYQYYRWITGKELIVYLD